MVKRSILFIIGSFLIAIGIIGFMLPLFPGFVPFIIGVVMISRSSSTVRHYLSRLKTIFPKQYKKLHEIRVRLFSGKRDRLL